MSAYIVNPTVIDYLVAWAARHQHGRHHGLQTELVALSREQIDALDHAAREVLPGQWRVNLDQVTNTDLGRILMRENVRSVSYRYGDAGHRAYWGEDHGMTAVAPDDLPGPVDQKRVWAYEFRRPAEDLHPARVIMHCDCWDYQSCETPDYRESLAYALMRAIREDAVQALVEMTLPDAEET